MKVFIVHKDNQIFGVYRQLGKAKNAKKRAEYDLACAGYNDNRVFLTPKSIAKRKV